MGTGWTGLDGKRLAKLLANLAWYTPSSNPKDETAKLKAVVDFWDSESLAKLAQDFRPENLRQEKLHPMHGFGHMVEMFALNHAREMLYNSPEGEEISRVLLNMLHEGEVSNGLTHHLKNADRVVFEQEGQTLKVKALVEVKSSARVARLKETQILRQKDSLQVLLRKIAAQETAGTSGVMFQGKRIEIADLTSFIFLPKGEGEKLIANHSPRWEDMRLVIREMELSLPEFIFLAEMLWPDFGTKWMDFSDSLFIASLKQWGAEKLAKLFADSIPKQYLGPLVIFSCLFQKVPVLAEGVIWAKSLIDNNSSFGDKPLAESGISGWEKDFLRKFSAMHKYGVFVKDMKTDIFDLSVRSFLAGLRRLRAMAKMLPQMTMAPFDVTILQ